MADMGTFTTAVGIEHPAHRGDIRLLPHVLVDSGAEATWIPRSVLASLGIRPERVERYQMANGHILEREVGFALVHVGGKATLDDVVFAEATDMVILGARSLEGLNLRVDSRSKRLVHAGPIITAASV